MTDFSCVKRTVYRDSYQVRQKLGCTATEENFDLRSRGIALPIKQKGADQLQGSCAADLRAKRFSHDATQ